MLCRPLIDPVYNYHLLASREKLLARPLNVKALERHRAHEHKPNHRGGNTRYANQNTGTSKITESKSHPRCACPLRDDDVAHKAGQKQISSERGE